MTGRLDKNVITLCMRPRIYLYQIPLLTLNNFSFPSSDGMFVTVTHAKNKTS